MAATNKPAAATEAELRALGEDSRFELIGGAITEKAMPRPAHSDSQGGLYGFLRRRFHRGPGGRWPGAGGSCRRSTSGTRTRSTATTPRAGAAIERPSEWPVRARPDWVCELLSPNHEKRDLDKLRTLHAHGVPHYWVVNPEEKTLVHRWESAGYLIALTATAGEVVRPEPFAAVELRLAVLFGDEDDEE